jgi:calreticulin
MKLTLILGLIASFVLLSSAKVYFKEEFDSGWEKRWVKSNWKESEGTRGEWGWTAGKHYNDAEADKGLQTSQDARFYAISSKISEPFSNEGKDLVLQYTVKHEQNIDCGGGYIKIFPSSLDQKTLSGDSEYNIMFGPDICGSSTRKVHLILTYKGKNHLLKKNVPCETDTTTHLYTMILHPDNTYEIQIDQKEVAKGSLNEDWDMLESKEIKDPNAKKPEDWVDEREIPDPEDKKPEGYDDIPAQTPDPEAKKPDDWDDELDGEWEAPMIANPEYKGEWKPKMIPNPAYKGEWVHPMVPNPNYVDDDKLYLFKDSAYVGFELWQVKAGTIFDNILVADSADEAKEHANNTWAKTVKGEKKMKEEDEEKKRKEEEEERKKREAEEKQGEEKEEAEEEEEEEAPAPKDEL